MAQFSFDAIGTAWRIDTYGALSLSEETALFSRSMARIDSFDRVYSRFRPVSLVTRMSVEAGLFTLPDDARNMLALYRDLYDRTGGLVTPLVGSMLVDAGYDAQYSLKQQRELQAPPAWDNVMEYRHPELTIKAPVLLDFGAAGKGYLIDLVAEVLEASGVHAYLIDAGGDILHKGDAPVRVGLEDPDNTELAIGIATLNGASICGSAGNRRAWGTFTHIMNPQTLASQEGRAAVWVVARTALLADALATALFFVEPAALADAYDFEYVLVRSDRSVERSAGFPGELFSASAH